MSAQEKPVYRFDGCELDPAERRLLVAGAAVTLTPKVFETLVLLVERAGHVVSKDELLRTLWPRGFVDESNLTKHIWLIRKALGERDPPWIETVPKLGYRFVAAVERFDAGADSAVVAQQSPPAPVIAPALKSSAPVAPPVRGTPRAWIAVAMLAACAAAWIAWRVQVGFSGVDTTVEGTSIAIAGFGNLSKNPKDAWLDEALDQMLASEIAIGGRVHAVPDELVRTARAELPAPLAGGYARRSLATLHKRLGADYVLSGGYLIAGAGDTPQLRIDLTLQDARSGAPLANIVRSGDVGGLNALVSSAGTELRDRLGMKPIDALVQRKIANLQPPSEDVARRVGFALDALHRNDPARARDELLGAIEQAPDYAPAYSYLARAWSALGYAQKAIAASRQARANARGLPDEQALQIEEQALQDEHDWTGAIAAANKLVASRPDNPEYRFQLVALLTSAGKTAEAQAAYDRLYAERNVIANDARLELAAAHLPRTSDADAQMIAHAERALAIARERDDAGSAAEAGMLVGIARWHRGDRDGSTQALLRARSDYARIGNPHGEAWADQNLGNALSDTDPQRAREAYQRALVTYEDIGDRAGEAAIHSNLSRLLWSSGDSGGAQGAVRSALALQRETADTRGQAWSLAALATIQMDQAASDEVAAEYHEALALDEAMDDRTHRAFVLAQTADLQRQRGDLASAAASCDAALAGYRQLGDGDGIATAGYECASIALDRGELDVAKRGFADAAKEGLAVNDGVVAINVALSLAQIDIAHAEWTSAKARLAGAVEESVKGQLVTGEANAQALLALCELRLGNVDASAHAATRAKSLRAGVTERMEVLGVDVALPQLATNTEDRKEAIIALRTLADDADRRGWIAWALETRLALLQQLESAHDATAAAVRDRLAADVEKYGFSWIRKRLG